MAKQVIYKPVRQMGARLVTMLDDRAAVESSLPRARLQVEALNSILVALGTVLNLPDASGKKAQWLPRRRINFLGFTVDAEQQSFTLPEEKKNALMRSLLECSLFYMLLQY